jgi:hypothetical protein
LVYSIAASTNKEFLIWGTYGSSSFLNSSINCSSLGRT